MECALALRKDKKRLPVQIKKCRASLVNNKTKYKLPCSCDFSLNLMAELTRRRGLLFLCRWVPVYLRRSLCGTLFAKCCRHLQCTKTVNYSAEPGNDPIWVRRPAGGLIKSTFSRDIFIFCATAIVKNTKINQESVCVVNVSARTRGCVRGSISSVNTWIIQTCILPRGRW